MESSDPKLIFCWTCEGRKKINGKKCGECRGLGAVYLRRGKVLLWNYPLERYLLRLQSGRRVLNKIRFFTILVLALNAWIWAGFFAYKAVQSTNLFSISAIPGYAVILFWVGCYLFWYIWYRVLRQKSHASLVEAFDYAREGEAPIAGGWPEVLKIPHHLRFNIADTFTDEALAVLGSAFWIADKQGTGELKPYHLFLALIEGNRIGNAFIRLGVSPKFLTEEFEKILKQGRPGKNIEPKLTEEMQKILFDAYERAYELHQSYVSVTELFIATVRRSEFLREVLFDMGIEDEKMVNVIEWARIRERLYRRYDLLRAASRYRSKQGMDKAMTAVATPYLNHFSYDLTLKAQFGGVEMCVAREKEIEEIFRVIEGGQQNVLLTGDFGVGKKTIIDGIAEKMVEGDVPKRLDDKRLVQLSIPALLSGATPSEAAERLMRVLAEIERAGNVILCINNIHELLGVSLGDGDKSLDVASALADSLGRGSFLIIASTTPEAYAKAINNSKLSSVFTKVEIKEMNENQSIQVLESKAGYIEYKEKIFFSYEALSKSVEVAKRFFRENPLPGSALELLTEAAALGRRKKGIDSLIGSEEVGVVASEKTHIPLTAITADESAKLLHLEEELHKRVVGQDEAVKLVSGALRRARTSMRSQGKPIANFLFLGPTGVGKTELAKTIAEVYFGGEKNMIRLDMSEYQDTGSIYRLIGSAGQKGTGILTEAVRSQPFSLLLLDEIEKADKDVLNLFLQVMDDGRLTDSTGRVVDFTNIILIATSNAATTYVQEQIKAGVKRETIKDALLHGGLKEYFRPEFLNRFDGIVLFEMLDKASVKQITALLLKRIAADLEAKGIRMTTNPEALDYFASVGFDPEFGARPLRRVLQEKVENELAELLIAGKLRKRDSVVLGEGGKIEVLEL